MVKTMKKIKDYYNVDLYVDDKLVVISEPFTTTKELISICINMSNMLSVLGGHCEVMLYRNGEYEYSYDFYNEYHYYRNICELIVAVYHQCEFGVYCDE